MLIGVKDQRVLLVEDLVTDEGVSSNSDGVAGTKLVTRSEAELSDRAFNAKDSPVF